MKHAFKKKLLSDNKSSHTKHTHSPAQARAHKTQLANCTVKQAGLVLDNLTEVATHDVKSVRIRRLE